MTKPMKWVCAQWRLSSAWALAQSDQSLCCLHEETLGPQLPIECTSKTLFRLDGCPGWFEPLLGTLSFCWFCHGVTHFCYISDQSHCKFRILQGDPGPDREPTPDMKSCMDRCRYKHACTSVMFTETYDGFDCILNTERDIPMVHRERNSFLFTKYCPEPGNIILMISFVFLIQSVFFILGFVLHLSRIMTKPTKWPAHSEDSDQTGHLPSLIWVLAVCMKKAWVLSYPLSAQRRLIRLGGCPGWFESSLRMHIILLVLSWNGSLGFCTVVVYTLPRLAPVVCSYLLLYVNIVFRSYNQSLFSLHSYLPSYSDPLVDWSRLKAFWKGAVRTKMIIWLNHLAMGGSLYPTKQFPVLENFSINNACNVFWPHLFSHKHIQIIFLFFFVATSWKSKWRFMAVFTGSFQINA